jgi:hypothetical protein
MEEELQELPRRTRLPWYQDLAKAVLIHALQDCLIQTPDRNTRSLEIGCPACFILNDLLDQECLWENILSEMYNIEKIRGWAQRNGHHWCERRLKDVLDERRGEEVPAGGDNTGSKGTTEKEFFHFGPNGMAGDGDYALPQVQRAAGCPAG